MSDLTEIIEDAVSDAALPEDTDTEVSSETEVEASPESTETDSSTTDTTESAVEAESEGQEVASPAARASKTPDEFEKKFGIPAQSDSGRENRIPHSRVQKIVGKAEKAVHDTYIPQLKERDDKISVYEERLAKVSQFEDVMVKDPSKFIQTLHDNLPQYRELLAPLFQPHAIPQYSQEQTYEQVDPNSQMPGPDFENPDGSKVYSEEGLANLINWAVTQGETRAVKAVEARYAPIEDSFQSYQTLQETSRKVVNQINEARTWPMFAENEDDITKALAADKRLSLEGAYRQVIFQKIQEERARLSADRTKIRQEVLADIKKAPASTSAPSRTATKAGPPSRAGGRSLEDVIKESMDSANLR